MTRVAVSQRVDFIPERGETRDSLDQRMASFLGAAGLVAVPVPNGLARSPEQSWSQDLDDWLAHTAPQAVLLSGGNDIGACADRDSTEMQLLTHAWERALPVLGICRGMQMLGNWAGTGLRPIAGHTGTRHRIYGEIGGEVNSFHDYALEACPDGFEVLARSADGSIEAMRHLTVAWEGWMWHPEREPEFANRDLERVGALFGGSSGGEA